MTFIYTALNELNTITLNTNTINILVLVAGTSDAGNLSELSMRAQSYGVTEGDKKVNYWDTAFVQDIEKFVAGQRNYELYPFHGWTGDNSRHNRKVAGGYLVNRLCGAEGEEAYYGPTYQSKTIHFHLLGHSHGGNVINEMTQQMAKLGDAWPKTWQVKSITYLSTPFFKKLHQVKVTPKTFHSAAEVLALHCDYDLTQRMLADFSLEYLGAVGDLLNSYKISEQICALTESIDEIPLGLITDYKVRGPFKDWAWDNWELQTPDIQAVTIPRAQGIILYNKTIATIEIAIPLVDSIKKLLSNLNSPIHFQVDPKIKLKGNTLNNKRTILGDNDYKVISKIFNSIHSTLEEVLRKLEANAKNTSGDFSKIDYVSAIIPSELLLELATLIDIDPATLKPVHKESLVHLITRIAESNIDVFDNTYVEPDRQFSGATPSVKITAEDVTDKDRYDGSNGSKAYYEFIKAVEIHEKNYEATPSFNNLLELILTLLANEKDIYDKIELINRFSIALSAISYLPLGKIDDALDIFNKGIGHLYEILKPRRAKYMISPFKNRNHRAKYYYGIFDETNEKNPEPLPAGSVTKPPQRGTLPYLLIESHSTSRRILRDPVTRFLTKMRTL